ncbi:MAG: hypothetical protein JWN86_1405 [Planctomycetota bacterium]|nr:hypothetical protein [Planctomycetota bacterium]
MTEPMRAVPRRPKKPRYADAARQFEESLLNNVLPGITSAGANYVALGVDMAAQEGNWGLSVLAINGDLGSGSLRLLLPHRFDLDEFKKQHGITPSGTLIARLVSGLADHGIPAVVAVDVPFGWPQEQSSFLNSWSAVPIRGKAISPPPRHCFEYRLCDRTMMGVLKRSGRSASVLAVGADKIASAAFQWANRRIGLPGFERVDVGYDRPEGGGVVYFETYPSAFVRLNYPSLAGYKTLKEAEEDGEQPQTQTSKREVRHDLLDAIQAEYRIETAHCAGALEAACATPASDAFDGLLSAITAWDYLRWRIQKAGTVLMSSPTGLLGPRTAATERARIEREGWFLVRMPEGAVATNDEGGDDPAAPPS